MDYETFIKKYYGKIVASPWANVPAKIIGYSGNEILINYRDPNNELGQATKQLIKQGWTILIERDEQMRVTSYREKDIYILSWWQRLTFRYQSAQRSCVMCGR